MADIEGNKYKELIQPIRDLAANWDVDIAENLKEYLEDLEGLRISFDGGNTNLNFAEAALLIQGSTNVYSKKVEYLHRLVLESLEHMTKKSSATAGQSKGGNGEKSMDEDYLMLFGHDPSFLLLDNLVEEGTNINIKTASGHDNRRTSRGSVSARYSIPHRNCLKMRLFFLVLFLLFPSFRPYFSCDN